MLNVGKEIAVLKHMTVAELRAKYAEVFGEETRSRHKEYLVKRIAWLAGRGRPVAAGTDTGGGTRQRRRDPHDPAPPGSQAGRPAGCSRDATHLGRQAASHAGYGAQPPVQGPHVLFIDATTNDPLYHFGAWYRFDLSFAPAP